MPIASKRLFALAFGFSAVAAAEGACAEGDDTCAAPEDDDGAALLHLRAEGKRQVPVPAPSHNGADSHIGNLPCTAEGCEAYARQQNANYTYQETSDGSPMGCSKYAGNNGGKPRYVWVQKCANIGVCLSGQCHGCEPMCCRMTEQSCKQLAYQYHFRFSVQNVSNGAPAGCIKYEDGRVVWVQNCVNNDVCHTMQCHGCQVITCDNAVPFAQNKMSLTETGHEANEEANEGGCYQEVKYAGLCYASCSALGKLEPRSGTGTCGGQYSGGHLKSCTSDGKFSSGGRAPGTGGRNAFSCFGSTEYNGFPDGTGQKFCSKQCEAGAKMEQGYCCDGNPEQAPTVTTVGGAVDCTCEKEKTFFGTGTNTLHATGGCSSGCQGKHAWRLKNNVAYCCPSDVLPNISLSGLMNLNTTCAC